MDIESLRVKRGFDKLSGVYDILAQMVFGKSIQNAQSFFLSTVKEGSRILIIGGGTGKLLENLINNNPSASIDYVELSEGMIDKAKLRVGKLNVPFNINFIQNSYEVFPEKQKYDLIITPFFFDMFGSEEACTIITKLKSNLVEKGNWIYTDFRASGIWWQTMLLKGMYLLFRWICRIEACELPHVKGCFHDQGFINLQSKPYYQGMIESVQYQLEER